MPASARIAYVVSPHGFGHAARAAAVLTALAERWPAGGRELLPQLFTTVPEWFWEDSLGGRFGYHPVLTDVGLVQLSPIEEDAAATLAALAPLRPLEKAAAPMARAFVERRCELVVCDISPLGLAAARLAGLPSVLVESFTWDWIYEAYFEAAPGLREAAAEMATEFEGAGVRVQTEPVCRPVSGAVSVPPVFRRPRSSPGEVRRRLGLGAGRPLVLVSMGGTAARFGFLDRLRQSPEIDFLVFAGVARMERRDNVLLLPDRSPIFVPDLIAAAEAVVGKLGYSTVAEAWGAGTRFVYVPRRRFPEGPFLASFVARELPSLEVDVRGFQRGEWLDSLPELLSRRRPPRRAGAGAARIAELLAQRLAVS